MEANVAVLTVLAFIFVLGFLVIAHELGHLITAKRAGIMVKEFGLGMPPRLFAIKRGETQYSLNLLPLGGFVKMAGEEDPMEPRGLASKGVGTRLLVLSAGSIMNALIPLVVFSAIYAIPQEVVAGDAMITSVVPGSPAEIAGLKEGDVILKINGKDILSSQDAAYNIHLNLGSPIDMLVLRDSTPSTTRVTPRWKPPQDQGATGIRVETKNGHIITQSYPLWQAIPMGVRRTGETLILTKNEIYRWMIGASAPQVAGPIGIAQMTGEVASVGFTALLEFTALLSLNLAILNILPIPMLDGGRVLFVAIEGIRKGKRIPPEKEALAHFIGFIALLTIIVIISYFDILRILRGESLVR